MQAGSSVGIVLQCEADYTVKGDHCVVSVLEQWDTSCSVQGSYWVLYTLFFFKDLGESVTLMHLRKVLMLQENMHSVCSRSLVAISLMASLLNHSISSFCIFF